MRTNTGTKTVSAVTTAAVPWSTIRSASRTGGSPAPSVCPGPTRPPARAASGPSNQPITSGGVTYRDEPWHTECFVCKTCRKQLSGTQFTAHENFLYCVDCYSQFIAKKCGTCHKPVTGFGGAEIVTSEGHQWHKECFKCKRCYSSLVNQRFVTHNREVYCTECGKNL